MYQWTLPSQGLLCQNVEAVCRRAQVGCCLAFLPSPHVGSTLARVSCPGIAPEWSAYCSLSPLSRTLDGRGIEASQGPLGQDL